MKGRHIKIQTGKLKIVRCRDNAANGFRALQIGVLAIRIAAGINEGFVFEQRIANGQLILFKQSLYGRLGLMLCRCILLAKISVLTNQLGDSFSYPFPFQQHIRAIWLFQQHAFCIVPFVTVKCTRYTRTAPACSIFFFEKFQLFICAMRFRKEPRNPAVCACKGNVFCQYRVDFILCDKAPHIRQFHLTFGQFFLSQCQISEPGQNVSRRREARTHQIGLQRDRIRKDFKLPDQFVQKFRSLHLLGELIDGILKSRQTVHRHDGKIVRFVFGTVAVHIDQPISNFSTNHFGCFDIFELRTELPGCN